jgi:hypothetical protein
MAEFTLTIRAAAISKDISSYGYSLVRRISAIWLLTASPILESWTISMIGSSVDGEFG